MSDNYTDWHPGNLIADSARAFKDAMTAKKRRARPKPRPRAEQARIDQLQAQPCPAQPGFTHWIPLGCTVCVRGCDLDLENTP